MQALLKRSILLALCLVAAITCMAAAQDGEPDLSKFTSIFDGKTLEGLQPFHGIKMLVDHVNYRGADGYDPKLTDWFWSTAGKLKDIPTDPMWSWAPLEIALELGTPYEQIWQRYEPAFITGELDIDTYWDEFVQEFRKGVYDKIEDWVNSTYDPKDYALTYNPQW